MKNNFFTLIGFEFKKIFKRKSTYLSFLMIAFIIIISSIGTIVGDHYVNGVKAISKYDMMNIDRQYSRANKGYIDEDKISDIIMQSKLLLVDKENLSSSNEVIVLSSKLGKNELIYAKIVSVILFSLIISLLTICTTILTSLFIYGFDGANVEIQVYFPLMPYPLTMQKAVIIMSLVSLTAILLISMFTMFMSSKLKNPFGVIIITNILIFAPMFISIPENNRILATILRILPVNMLEISDVFSEYFFVFGDYVFTPYEFLPIFSLIACISLIPFSFKSFKNYQVG